MPIFRVSADAALITADFDVFSRVAPFLSYRRRPNDEAISDARVKLVTLIDAGLKTRFAEGGACRASSLTPLSRQEGH